jgi:ribokinase
METSNNAHIVVVGSINMDLVATAPVLPQPGQTVLGRDFRTIPGGKGANQAVAAARLGASVALVAKVGEDAHGKTLQKALRDAGVNCDAVQTTAKAASGVALIVVSDTGENAICVASGANAQLMPADVNAAADLFRGAGACLVQLEIPIATVVRAIELARENNVPVVLDPAPVRADMPDALFDVDILTPNVTEAATLVPDLGLEAPPDAISAELLKRGPRAIVLKRGRDGCYVHTAEQRQSIAAKRVEVVDTTAAGDVFSAALAVARAEGHDLVEAARFANAAGALACTKQGAQPSAPTREDTLKLMLG